jgi:hypothetical protein
MPHPPHLSRALGLGLALACASPRPPEARPALARTPCPDTVAGPHDGIDLTHDVRRGPRARIDSTGALQPLPAIPMHGDTTPCAQSSDTAARSSSR